jgi:hypothetical protein
MRRALVALFLAASAFAHASLSEEWRFKVLLDGSEIGTHRFRVEERDGERRVRSDARFTVKFLFFDAYTYVHEARERWRGNCLQAIESRTDDNGERRRVRGARGDDRFEVATRDGKEALPACVMTFAYWNPAMLREARLLNAQTGAYDEVRVEPLGEEVLDVRGLAVSARRYALHARDFRIDVWYAADSRWVQLESRTAGGRLLRYLIQ